MNSVTETRLCYMVEKKKNTSGISSEEYMFNLFSEEYKCKTIIIFPQSKISTRASRKEYTS